MTTESDLDAWADRERERWRKENSKPPPNRDRELLTLVGYCTGLLAGAGMAVSAGVDRVFGEKLQSAAEVVEQVLEELNREKKQ